MSSAFKTINKLRKENVDGKEKIEIQKEVLR